MTLTQNRTLVLRFRIEGNLRYLSHQETMTMFQRLLRRSGIELCYSQGYNPRPKMSLPLPRTVGIASDAEVLCASVHPQPSTESASSMGETIRSQLPEGCTITELSLVDSKVSYKPCAVVYEFPLAAVESVDQRIANLMRQLEDKSPLCVERAGTKKKPARTVDVAPYIGSIELNNGAIRVKSNITPGGTVRIDEILHLLEIDAECLAGPITRKSVEWAA